MKLEFDESGANFIEVKHGQKDGTIAIILSSRDGADPTKNIVNSVVITQEQFDELVADI